jgi:hypothetical protein
MFDVVHVLNEGQQAIVTEENAEVGNGASEIFEVLR